MDIYLIRHTNVAVSKKICYGQVDVPLADSVKNDINLVTDKLKNICPIIVYSSPLKRCISLANQLSSNVIIDERLKEIDMGEWEMKTYDEIGKEAFKHWLGDLENRSAPNGENYKKLSKRALSVYQDIVKSTKKTTFIVTHDGIIRMLIANTLKIPIANTRFLKLKYGSISKIVIKNGIHYLDTFNH